MQGYPEQSADVVLLILVDVFAPQEWAGGLLLGLFREAEQQQAANFLQQCICQV